MLFSRIFCLLPIALAAGTSFCDEAFAQEEATSLLALEDTGFETELTVPEHLPSIRAMLDGDADTIARFDIIDGEPVDVVIGFGERVASATELVLNLSNNPSDTPPARVDVLVSSYSPTTGFRSVFEERIDALQPEQVIKLPPAAAAWVMVRFFPADGQVQFALTDMWLMGREGPPEPQYAFGEAPATAITMIEELETYGGNAFSLSAVEQEIFQRVKTEMLDTRDLEEIALLASGVVEQSERDAYRAQLDGMEAQIRAELDLNTTPFVVGERLLEWLHANAFSNGYRLQQTDVSTVLDEGIFNCVSSAVLYNILGWRLGLDLRTIEVPDHAFSILYDGVDHVDVETTTRRGFAPAREQIEEFRDLTGFNYIPQSNKDLRREIDRNGTAALIYYNHGVEFHREGKYREALLANFRAMSLDPEFSSAVTNALASLSGWARSLGQAGEWEQATTVAALGRRLSADDDILTANQRAVWSQWADSLSASGDYVAALEILEQATLEIPDQNFDPDRVAVFLRPAEKAIARGEWDQAFAISNRAVDLLKGDARSEIDEWRSELYLRQARSLIAKKNYATAADLLEQGIDVGTEPKSVQRLARYLAQEWAKDSPDIIEGLSKIADLSTRFAAFVQFDSVTENYVLRQINAGVSARTLEDTLAVAQEIQPLITATGSDFDAGAHAYNAYGRPLIDDGDWQAAAELHSAGLATHPDDYYLSRNARYVAQRWQSAALSEGGPSELEAVNKTLRELFPTFAVNPGFEENEIIRKINAQLRDGDYDGAESFLTSAQLLLSPESFRKLRVLIIDHRAQVAMKDNNWEAAATLYSNGRSELGDGGLFSNNVAYVAQEWTRSAGTEAGAQGVASTAEKLDLLFPGDKKVAKMGTRTIKSLISDAVRMGEIDLAKTQLASARPFLSPKDFDSSTIVLYRDWGNARLEQNDWKGALFAYAAGLELVPDSRDLRRNIPYTFQEWSKSALDKGGAKGLINAVEEMEEAFPDKKTLSDVLDNVLSGRVEGMINDDRPDAALKLVDDVAVILDPDTTHDVKVYAYEKWARLYFNNDGWLRAVEIYDQGLEDVGKSSLLENNRRYAQSKADEAALAPPPEPATGPLDALDADSPEASPELLKAWLEREGYSGWELPDIKVNLAASAFGGRVLPTSSREKGTLSPAYLNDGMPTTIGHTGLGGCNICGWMSGETTPVSSLQVEFPGERASAVNAVVIDTELLEFAPFPFFYTPTQVEIFARESEAAQFELVAEAIIPKDGRRNLIPLPHGLVAQAIRIDILGTHLDHAPALAEVEVWEDFEGPEASVVKDIQANLLSPTMGGRLISFTSSGREGPNALLMADYPKLWESKGNHLPQEMVFAFGDYENVFIDSLRLLFPQSAPIGERPSKIAVEVTDQDHALNMRTVFEGPIDSRGDSFTLPLTTDARLLRIRILDRNAPEAGKTVLGNVQLLEGRRADYVSMAFRPPLHQDFVSNISETPQPTLTEQEPNNTLETAQRLAKNERVVGTAADFSDADVFALPPVSENASALLLDLKGLPDMRHALDLLDGDGTVLATFTPAEVRGAQSELTFALDLPISAISLRPSGVTSVLIWDTSGSMEGSEQALEHAVRNFISTLPEWHRVQLIRFSKDVEILTTEFTSDKDALLKALEGKFTPDGATRLHDAIKTGLDLLDSSAGRRGLILFGDGIDSASEISYGDFWSEIRSTTAKLYTIGMGSDFAMFSSRLAGTGTQLFDALARETNGRNYFAYDSKSLDTYFAAISKDLEAPAFYDLSVRYGHGTGYLIVGTSGEELPPETMPQTHVIMDLSGSMSQRLANGQTKIAAAKTALQDLLNSIPDKAPFGLTVYGAQIPEKRGKDVACRDIETLVPVSPLNRDELDSLITSLEPIGGTTPLVESIATVAGNGGLPKGSNLVVITDGVEECVDDPIAALAKMSDVELNRLDFSLIGFDLRDKVALDSISGMAKAGGGTFYDASNATAVSRAMKSAFAASVLVRDSAHRVIAREKVDGGWIALSPGSYLVEIAKANGALVLREVEILDASATRIDVKKTGDIVEATVVPPKAFDPFKSCGEAAAALPPEDRVRRIQSKLGQLNIDVGSPDNVVGPATLRGIEAFFGANGISDQPVVSISTEQHLDCVIQLGRPYRSSNL